MARLRVPRLDAIAYPGHDVNPLTEESVAREAVFSVTATNSAVPTCQENFTAPSRIRVAGCTGLSVPRHGHPVHAGGK